MFYSLRLSYALTAILTLPAAGLLTRIFIFQHDCGHRSFFNSKAANDWTGRALSLLTVTPYDFWRRAHNMHHSTSGNLNKRSIGGIDTVTVREYLALPKARQVLYRLYRHPLILLIIGTPLYVIIAQRIPFNAATNFYDDYKTLGVATYWKSVMSTNIMLLLLFGGIASIIGLYALAAVYLPVLILTSIIGGWLFYIQHQFEETYWAQNKDWDRREAALMGSSYYALPKLLQWFTGNIGLHHIHHLCSQVPNYKLQDCMDTRPELKYINKMTLSESLACASLKLWDEKNRRLISFKELKSAQRPQHSKK